MHVSINLGLRRKVRKGSLRVTDGFEACVRGRRQVAYVLDGDTTGNRSLGKGGQDGFLNVLIQRCI